MQTPIRKLKFLAVLGAFLALLGASAGARPAFAEATRVTNPNAVSFEVLGRAARYSIDYDRVVSDDITVGIGFGSANMQTTGGTDAAISAYMIPVYGIYYFKEDGNSFFVTGGANVVTNATDVAGLQTTLGHVRLSSTGLMGTVGAGFESRSDFGFLFRVAAYALFDSDVKPWVGANFGYAF